MLEVGDVEFGQDISFVACVIRELISELHQWVKPMLRPVRRPSPNYRECLLSSVTKLNIEM